VTGRQTTAAEMPWVPAMARALVGALLETDGDEDDSRLKARIRDIGSPLWVPARPPRRLPPLWTIASYWAGRGEPFAVDLASPHCFACWAQPECTGSTPRQRWGRTRPALERSHLVGRARDGLDGPQNLVPLCVFCNRMMPAFGIDRALDAIAWVQAGGAVAEVMERFERRRRAETAKPARRKAPARSPRTAVQDGLW
jgi:hypothetical protein